MPNWAYCNLDIYGPVEEIIMYKVLISTKETTASGEEFDSYDPSLAHPMPDILVGTRSPTIDSPEIPQRYYEWLADGTWTQDQFDQWKNDHEAQYYRAELAFKECGYRDWYSWCNDNWGAKWSPSDVIAEEVDLMSGHWQLHFNSPWSPPTALIRETARRFPRLAFILSFREESKAYTGAIGYRLVDDDVEECEEWYNFDDDTLPESISMRRDAAQEKLTKALDGDPEFDQYELYDELDDIDMDLALYAVEEVEEAMDVSSLTK
jgi:hypothetical protein